eukprot:scaffold5472_cov146-Skeletonema_menzelii.AAC.27
MVVAVGQSAKQESEERQVFKLTSMRGRDGICRSVTREDDVTCYTSLNCTATSGDVKERATKKRQTNYLTTPKGPALLTCWRVHCS